MSFLSLLLKSVLEWGNVHRGCCVSCKCTRRVCAHVCVCVRACDLRLRKHAVPGPVCLQAQPKTALEMALRCQRAAGKVNRWDGTGAASKV